MLQLDQDFQSQNGAGWIKPAAGAAAGGTVILLAARRRRKKAAQRAEAARSVKSRAVRAAKEAGPTVSKGATVVAAKAGPVAKGAQERVTEGLDRVAKDRRLQTYAFAGFALVWFLFRVSELRQLRRLNKRIA